MKLPDRWLPYKPMGERITGTRFISFKVPLKQTFSEKLGENERFTPEMLMEQCPAVQLIIDLTNTSRYYNSQTFTNAGVSYRKIMTPGHVIPARRYIQEFFQAVDDFLANSEDDDSLIGVHCTHGLNRTSYFVCCYMIHQMGFEPQDAVAAFEKARGHKIERQNYVNDLMIRGMGSADTERQSFVREKYPGPTGPVHRGPKWQDSRPYRDSKSNGQAKWRPKPNGPVHCVSRPNGPAHWNPMPNGPAHWNPAPNEQQHWNPRLYSNSQYNSRPNGHAHWDSRSKGGQYDRRDRGGATSSNWRSKPEDSSSQHGYNNRSRNFEPPRYGHPSSSLSNETFHEEHSQKRTQGNSNQQHSTYKEWRAAKEAASHRQPSNQSSSKRQPPNQQSVHSQGSSQRQPKS